MDAQQIEQAIARLAREIGDRAAAEGAAEALAIVGIRRGGVHLAARLRRALAARFGQEPPTGTLDIALYRDDLAARGAAPVVGPTDIRFQVQGRTIVLVDDVLYTGRTVHGGGANTTAHDRYAVNVDYVLGWLRQEENQYLSVPLDVVRTLPERVQRLMGYGLGAYALGYIDDVRDPISLVRDVPHSTSSFAARD